MIVSLQCTQSREIVNRIVAFYDAALPIGNEEVRTGTCWLQQRGRQLAVLDLYDEESLRVHLQADRDVLIEGELPELSEYLLENILIVTDYEEEFPCSFLFGRDIEELTGYVEEAFRL